MGTKFGSKVLWTKKEDAILRRIYESKGFTACFDKFNPKGRSSAAIYSRIRRLGLVGGHMSPDGRNTK